MIAVFGIHGVPEPGPLVVAAMRICDVHLTQLANDGTAKAEVDNPKVMIAPSSGLPVVCAPINYIGGLALAEGSTDALSLYQATGSVREALRVLMEGTSISPRDEDCVSLRANIAIRRIVHFLYDQSEEYHLPADLKAAPYFVATGAEEELPDYLRREWEQPNEPSRAL